jgi:hypothetical protein
VQFRRADVLGLLLGPVTRLLAVVGRRPAERVVVPVSERAWRSLRRGLRGVALLAGLAAGALFMGLVTADPSLLVLTGVLLVAAYGVRVWVLWRRWVGLVLRPGGEEVTVTRVDPAFADAARRLFTASILGRPA